MSAWTVIAHTEVGSGGASSIEFTSISGSYTDLLIKCSLRTNRAATFWDWLKLTFNGSATSYSGRVLYGNGAGSVSTDNSGGITTYLQAALINGDTATASTFANTLIYIPNYSGNTNKSVSADGVTERNATDSFQSIFAGLWSNTNAITSVTLSMQEGTQFVQYSSATLYGITKGSSGGVTVS